MIQFLALLLNLSARNEEKGVSMAVQVDIKAISNAEQNIVITIKNDEKIRLKAKSKDDDDIINEILIFLRKGIR